MGKIVYAINETVTINNDTGINGGINTIKTYSLHAFTSYDEFAKCVEDEEKFKVEAKRLQGFDKMEIKWSFITNDIENGKYPEMLIDLIKKYNKFSGERLSDDTASKKISRFIEGKEELIKVGHKRLYIGSVGDVQKEVEG